MPGFTLASDTEVKPVSMNPAPSGEPVEEVFHGDATMESSVSMLGGYFAFDPVNAAILLDFLPKMLRIRATDPAIGSIAAVVELIQREARERRAGRALVLARLIEVMLVEALRSAPAGLTPTGLLAGLRDPQLAAALRAIHTNTAHPWTLATLAREAAMSRSSFAERFARVIGMTPLNYLLQWRLAVAKDMLAREQKPVAETALAVGYESASGFSTAFSRETGRSPREFIGPRRRDWAPRRRSTNGTSGERLDGTGWEAAHDALRRNPKGSWQMPAKTLYRTLFEKCQGRVLRADSGRAKPPPEGAEKEFSDLFESNETVVRWTEAQRRAKVEIEPLFFDLTLP